MLKEKKDWSETIYTERIRISKEDKTYINKIKKKKSLAGMLSEIIKMHKYAENKTRPKPF